MKESIPLYIVLLSIPILFLSDGFAQDWTQWHLPEGAIARLGKGKINDVKFSPDGNRLAVATDIGVWIYDAHTGAEIVLIKVEPRGIQTAYTIAFAPDSRTLAVGNWILGGAIELWDATTGKRLAILKENIGSVKKLEFSVDGTMLVCASWAKRVEYYMWEVATGREILHFTKAQDVILANKGALALSQNPHLVASMNMDTVRMWDVATEELRHTLEGDRDTGVLAFSPDGKTLAGGGIAIRLWATETGNELSKFDGHTRLVEAITFSPDGRSLASGDSSGKIILWRLDAHNQKSTLPRLLRSLTGGKQDSARNNENRTLTGHTLSIKALDFTTDSRKLASGSQDGTVIVWDVETEKPLVTLTGHTGFIKGLRFLEDDKTLISGGNDGTIRLWDIDTRTEQIIKIKLPGFTSALTFSRDGKTIGMEYRSQVQLWNTETQSFSTPLTGHNSHVLTVAFSPDDTLLASGSGGGEVILWDVQNRQHFSTLDSHTDQVKAVVFSSDGKKFASASKDGTVHLLDLQTEKKAALPTEPNSSVEALTFSPDSSTLVSARRDGIVQLWDANTYQHIADFINVKGTMALAFSPDGKTVVTGSRDGLIQLWDVNTRIVRQEIRTGDAAWATKFAFTPDGRTLASGSWDGTVLVWNLEQ